MATDLTTGLGSLLNVVIVGHCLLFTMECDSDSCWDSKGYEFIYKLRKVDLVAIVAIIPQNYVRIFLSVFYFNFQNL